MSFACLGLRARTFRKLTRGRILGRDRRGSVAVEFAMIGGALLMLILGTMQAGLYLYVSATLEAAVVKATRQVMTGSVTAGTTTAAQFRSSVLCPLLPAAMPCANVITNLVTVSEGTYPNGFYQFVNANQSWIVPPTMNNTQTSFCTGSAGSVIYAQVYYAMPLIVPLLFKAFASTWQGQSVFFVGAFAAFRNEPFQATSQGSC